MHTYNTAPPTDELARAQTELNHVKDIMVQNVEQILSRGERIELLVDKTDSMANQATAFRRGARSVRRQMWWKNSKILALCILVALVRRNVPHLFLGMRNCARYSLLTYFPSADFDVDTGGSILWCWPKPMRNQLLDIRTRLDTHSICIAIRILHISLYCIGSAPVDFLDISPLFLGCIRLIVKSSHFYAIQFTMDFGWL